MKLAGGIRVNRASGSNEPLEHAIRVLEAGEAVAHGAGGHDPAWPGVLRPRAEGPLGRRPPGSGHPRPGDPRAGSGAPRRSGRATSACRGWTSASRPRSASASASRSSSSTAASTPTPSGSWRRSSTSCPTRPASSARRPTEELLATFPPGYKGDPTRESHAPSRHRHLRRRHGRRASATRAAVRAADVRRRGVDVERREGPVAEPERRHARPCSTARSTSTTSAARSPPPSPPCRGCASG